MSKNSYNLLNHAGNSIYPQNSIKDYLNSFCLLNKTIANVYASKQIEEKPIDLIKMKEYDKINNEKVIIKKRNDISSFNSEKYNFIQNSFYNNILINKKKYENIHNNEEFRMLQNEDKSNSSFFYHIQIINKLKEKGELKKVEEQMKKNISDYEKENYCLISNKFECNGINKNFNYYRRIKANGNSFYISFIYQYIKNLILNSQESIISEIFYIMDKEQYLSNNNNNNNKQNNNFEINENTIGQMYIYNSITKKELTNVNQAFALFSLIYNKMIERNIPEAEKILDYAFAFEEIFANFFCLFMKLQIKNFIINNKNIFTYEKYCKNSKLIEEKYYKNGIFLHEEYIFNNVLINQMEPTLFIISLVPYVFNVSMNLYINEKNHKFEKICFDLKDKYDTYITISILYSSFSYHIVERHSNLNKEGKQNIDYADTLNLNNKIMEDKKEEEYMVNNNKGTVCNNCKKSKFIILKNINKYEVCLNCLKETINEILIERYEKMIFERFKYLEFYLRDIPILYTDNDSNNYRFLSPPEFYFLYKKNLFTYFRDLIDNICVYCRKYKNNLIEKKCGCKYCIEDLQKEITFIPILDFEKEYLFKNNKKKCKCGMENDFIELAMQLYNKYDNKEKDKIKKSYNERIVKYCKKYCMYCGKDLKRNAIGNEKRAKETIKFNIGEKENVEHCICEECQIKMKSNNLSDVCIICGEKHNNNENNKNEIKEFCKSSNNHISKNDNQKISTENEIEKECIITNVNNNNNKIKDINNRKKKSNSNKTQSCKRKNGDTVCCIIY